VKFDQEFHREMQALVVEPAFDFRFYLNELKPAEKSHTESEYTAKHLDTVQHLLGAITSWLPTELRMDLKFQTIPKSYPATLGLRFTDMGTPNAWVCVFLCKLTFKNVQDQINEAIKLLAYKQRARYTLWLLRTHEIRVENDTGYAQQTYRQVTPQALESRLKALIHLASKQTEYENGGHWAEARRLIKQEFDQTYLGEVFREARKHLDALLASNSQAESEETTPASS
jgi:hypothetical protein